MARGYEVNVKGFIFSSLVMNVSVCHVESHQNPYTVYFTLLSKKTCILLICHFVLEIKEDDYSAPSCFYIYITCLYYNTIEIKSTLPDLVKDT